MNVRNAVDEFHEYEIVSPQLYLGNTRIHSTHILDSKTGNTDHVSNALFL